MCALTRAGGRNRDVRGGTGGGGRKRKYEKRLAVAICRFQHTKTDFNLCPPFQPHPAINGQTKTSRDVTHWTNRTCRWRKNCATNQIRLTAIVLGASVLGMCWCFAQARTHRATSESSRCREQPNVDDNNDNKHQATATQAAPPALLLVAMPTCHQQTNNREAWMRFKLKLVNL